ncbi:NTP transferase domain-containing protein [Hymenobacter sp. BT491]|uniref:nucleotidyltransferase family protein n=1 Tax=Hymenobacter sp. BT491 TaxID=2766779 RepID=UPI001653B7CF|nr:nucleotidyltransferase family protein [Hymenobacter sp. BT491]MBC6989073.1 nucleotidyltransferase family protein [Hymenobacter sp. BT491]
MTAVGNERSASVGLMLLAAGASSRLGQPKQLVQFQGKSLLRRAAEAAVASGCHPIIVVTGALHSELLPELEALPVAAVPNPQWQEGMSSSIRAGLAALEAQTASGALGAVVVMLCDQPFVNELIIKGLVDGFDSAKVPAVASAYGGRVGVPALFGQQLFPALRTLAGPEGARDLLRQHAADLLRVPFPEGAIDVDTPEQYRQLLQQAAPPQ